MTGGFEIVPLSRDRAIMRDILTVSARRHTIHGLLEVDVTEARQRIGELSFTAFLIHCYARALAEEPHLNAIRRGRRVYRFGSINVGTLVEVGPLENREVAGLVVRDADTLSVQAIHAAIRDAQARSVPDLARREGVTVVAYLPGPVRRAAVRAMLARPAWAHDHGMINGVTAVGMFGHGMGWGIPVSVGAGATSALTVGGIGHRPRRVAGGIEDREVLCLTLSFDHDLVDGAPATRFADILGRLIEAADGLPGPQADDSEPGGQDEHRQPLPIPPLA